MNIIIDLAILACLIACAGCAYGIHKKTGEGVQHLRRLLVFLDGVHIEHRGERREDRAASAVFRKTLTTDLRGCRDSIDAIRATSDELSEHRRETVEVRAPLSSAALPASSDPLGSASDLPSGPAQIAAGLSRPKSHREPPSASRRVRIDAPPRSQTIVGMAAPEGPHRLPPVLPPPPARPRVTATLPSMEAVVAPGITAAAPVSQQTGEGRSS